MSNLQLNKLKIWIVIILSNLEHFLNVVGDVNDESKFWQKFQLFITQVSRLLKAFANGSSATIILSKAQLKLEQPGKFLSRILGPLLKLDCL